MEDEFKMKKDDRNKGKRSKLRNYKKVRGGHVSTTPELQSVIDVADSSDDTSYKREKSNNWARYEEDTEADFTENEQMTAADFELLQEHPTQPGTQFTFSSEKEWENDTETSKTMNISYFNLNLTLLNAGLKTIPFYKRLEYGESIFPKQKIKEMDVQAEKAEAAYKGTLLGVEEELKNKMLSSLGEKSTAKTISTTVNPEKSEKIPETATPIQDGKDEELDKLLNMAETDFSNPPTEENPLKSGQDVDVEKTETGVVEEQGDGKEVEAGNKGDMQKWLDSLLDD